jgi:hypothetical protein
MGLLQRWSDRLNPAAAQLERHRLAVPLVLLAVYLLITAALAAVRLLWYDELFTFYLSQFSSLSELWSNLSTTEPNPPLTYLLTRGCFTILGDSALATRLPEILGFGLLLLSLYFLVARRCRPAYAWLALLLPLSTNVYHYAHEARPYGLVLGFCGLSLLCWQVATEGRRRPLALFGLALSLAAGLCSHYYAVLLFLPLGVGELVRTYTRKRLDLPVWAALALGGSALLLLFPLIRAARASTGTFWAIAEWSDLPETYVIFLTRALPPVLVGAVLLSLPARSTRPGAEPEQQTASPSIPAQEWAAALTLALLPVFAVVLGKAFTGVYVYRYAVATVVGVSLLLAFAAARRAADSAVIGTALAAVFLGWFLVIGVATFREFSRQPAALARMSTFLDSKCKEQLPIAVAGSHLFLELAHYAPPALAPRLVYVTDPEASLRHLRADTDDLALRGLSRVTAVPVVDLSRFLAANSWFYVYGDDGWLLPELKARGADVEEIGQEEGRPLFGVRLTD